MRSSQVMKNYLKQAEIFWGDLAAPLFSTEWGRRASWGALGLFVLLLTVSILQSFSVWHDDFVITHTPSVTSNANSARDSMLQSIAQVPDEHLFGRSGAGQGAVPITSLQLRLVGIVKMTPENLSRVIISEAGQPGKVYSIGDTLPSGISVNEIEDDGVILENGGHLEKLPMQRTPLAFQGMPKPLLDREG